MDVEPDTGPASTRQHWLFNHTSGWWFVMQPPVTGHASVGSWQGMTAKAAGNKPIPTWHPTSYLIRALLQGSCHTKQLRV